MGAAAAVSPGASTYKKSNVELVQSLKMNIRDAILATSEKGTINDTPTITTSLTNGGRSAKRRWKRWTTRQDSHILYVPSIDSSFSGLQEEREQYDITVKMFYLRRHVSAEERELYTKQALDLVLTELGMPSVDLLIISYPDAWFNLDDQGCDDVKDSSHHSDILREDVDTQVKTWHRIEKLHDKGLVSKLGIAEFGMPELKQFNSQARIHPSVNQINLRDCCSVPKDLTLYAKEQKIELLVHNDCTNILPRGTVRELLGPANDGAGFLTTHSSESIDIADQNGIPGEVTPQWVVKYTAVVRNRGVVENKGYFALAQVDSPPSYLE